MYRVTILFGRPTDLVAFERYYHDVHFPIAARVQGVKGLTLGKCESIEAQQPSAYYRVTSFYFATRAACQEILASPEGQAALADLPNFATGGYMIIADEEKVAIPFSLAAAHSAHSGK